MKKHSSEDMKTPGQFAVLTLLIGTCFAQTQTMCNHNVCMETANLEIENNKVTIGVALPTVESGLNEFLMNASVPLPYGFLSIQMGPNEVQMCDFSITEPLPLPTPAPPNHHHNHFKMNTSDLRSQACTESDGSLLTNPMLANTTISSKSALLGDHLQIVSRINSTLFGVQDLFSTSSESSVIRVTISKSAPLYLDSSKMTALLDLSNSSSQSFNFNHSAGTFENYTAMVDELGV
ncbi:hypothetical protein SCHPADRAFT_943113 [Schizopora paradoxa]|uniref:Uncharacterized protein n=1 Tax=Schizopora paradoxa TaxID=27342 RepID=A0A0H2RKT5_9AGAM|nr:hypothetical protein SCHPADRAFT_943113 [Schizopora paradoxa]